MTTYVALVRAVNVGGTGTLSMPALLEMCRTCGFTAPTTYAVSGNAIFESDTDESDVKSQLEALMATHAGKTVPVFVRSAQEIAAVVNANPFPDAEPSKVIVFFLDREPEPLTGSTATGATTEMVVAGTREIYVHYPDGIGRSKLKLPSATAGTGRSINTVTKLAGLALGRKR